MVRTCNLTYAILLFPQASEMSKVPIIGPFSLPVKLTGALLSLSSGFHEWKVFHQGSNEQTLFQPSVLNSNYGLEKKEFVIVTAYWMLTVTTMVKD